MNLIERAKELAPRLREASDEGKRLRRLPDATWKALLDAGIMRGLQPARWGGAEAHPAEFFEAIAEVSRADGSHGWVAGIIGVHPWQLALFPKETQQEVWGADATVMHSSSYAPTGKAVKVSGGYRLSGRWSFSTGCDHCRWVNLGAIGGGVTIEGAEVPDFRSFMIPRSDYRIDDNWNVAGLCGTGSKDIVIEDAFVPEHHTQSHWDYALGRELPGWEHNPGPLYRLPFAVVFNYALVAAVLGAARGFLDLWIEISKTRKGGLGAIVSEDPYCQSLLAESSYAIESGFLVLRHDLDELMDAAKTHRPVAIARRAAIRYAACRSAQLAAHAIDKLFESSSGKAIFLDHPLQRRFQDIKAMQGHAYLNVDQPARMAGALAFGQRVMNPFV
ncbi:MAG TPA: acyl-CoA dehydrogenase family protein [Candidatus Binataceae bacterium]|nr:acyl-CoA dehydrogenase family protein [Candidatus Binataceae bacterium]